MFVSPFLATIFLRIPRTMICLTVFLRPMSRAKLKIHPSASIGLVLGYFVTGIYTRFRVRVAGHKAGFDYAGSHGPEPNEMATGLDDLVIVYIGLVVSPRVDDNLTDLKIMWLRPLGFPVGFHFAGGFQVAEKLRRLFL